MKLYIDTSSNTRTVIRIDEREFVEDSTTLRSQVLLPMIERSLEKMSKTLHDLTEIEVAVGPGSFQGLRVGVSIANALGYSLNIPVNGKMISENEIIEPKYS